MRTKACAIILPSVSYKSLHWYLKQMMSCACKNICWCWFHWLYSDCLTKVNVLYFSIDKIAYKSQCFSFTVLYFCSSKGWFTNTCKGGWCKKILKNFQGPPFRTTKFFGPPFCREKIRVNPTENHIDPIFTGKIRVIFFFHGPPLKGPKFSVPIHFASGPPNKCLWTVLKKSSRELCYCGYLVFCIQ